MGTQWIRQEIRKDPFAEFIDNVLEWVKSHRDYAIGIGATVIAAAILAGFVISRHSNLKKKAWEQLFMAQQYAGAGQSDEYLKRLRELQSGLPGTPAAAFSIISEGDALYRQGLYKQAVETYRKIAEKGQPADLAPFALSGIVISNEADGNFENAAAAARQFLDRYPDNFLAAQVYSSLARSLEARGAGAEAKAALEKITVLYPETYWAGWAKDKLAEYKK